MINTTTCKVRQAANALTVLFWKRSISANNSSTNYNYVSCLRNLDKWQPDVWGSCEEPLEEDWSEEDDCGAEPSASSRCLCCSAFLSLSRCRPLRIIANSGPINSDKQEGGREKKKKAACKRKKHRTYNIQNREEGWGDWSKREATDSFFHCNYMYNVNNLLTPRNYQIKYWNCFPLPKRISHRTQKFRIHVIQYIPLPISNT